MPPRVDIAPEIVLSMAFMAAVDELLDQREQRVAAQAAQQADACRMEEATSKPHVPQVPSMAPQPTHLTVSVAIVGTGATMDHSPGIMTREEVEELVSQKMKDQKGRAMPSLRDRASYPFAPKILTVMVLPHVKIPQIDYYREEGEPVEYIQRHEASLLGHKTTISRSNFQ